MLPPVHVRRDSKQLDGKSKGRDPQTSSNNPNWQTGTLTRYQASEHGDRLVVATHIDHFHQVPSFAMNLQAARIIPEACATFTKQTTAETPVGPRGGPVSSL